MIDGDIFGRINALSDEEERLWEHAGDGHGLTTEEQERLDAIKVELDRAYDLLHQRDARRAAGLDRPRRDAVLRHRPDLRPEDGPAREAVRPADGRRAGLIGLASGYCW